MTAVQAAPSAIGLRTVRGPGGVPRTVDDGTVPLSPGPWGGTPKRKPGTDPVAWGTKWIDDHLADGAKLGKPAAPPAG